MLNVLLKSLSVMFSVCLVFGCSEQKKVAVQIAPPVVAAPVQPSVPEKIAEPSETKHSPALTATESKSAKPETELPVVGKNPEQTPVVTPETANETVKQNPLMRPFREVAYLPEGVVGLFVGHPKQFFESPIGRLVNEFIDNDDVDSIYQPLKKTGVKLQDIERMTVFVDQTQINIFAQQSGLPVGGDAAAGGPVEAMRLTNSSKQIGLAFHNYHDVFQRFPRADGDGAGQHTGLSWRVHLLPFLDQAPLYNQFHFDEAWDSDHNKTLIGQMPEIFKSPGVDDAGKTAFHVFTGENTMFHGEEGLGIRDVTDGASNTILAVLAGADTAEIWTKPGGLEVDLSSPKKALGHIKENERVLVLIADGTVRTIPAETDETQLAHLIQPADGNVIDFGPPAPVNEPMPAAIFALARDLNEADLIKGVFADVFGGAKAETHLGTTFHKNPIMAVWQPDPRTIVVGPAEVVKRIISAKQTGNAVASPLIEQLRLSADFTLAFDMESQSSLLRSFAESNPMMGMVTNIKTVASQVMATAKEGDSLIEINVTAVDEAMAGGLFAMGSLAMNQWKIGVSQLPLPTDASASDKEMQAIIKNLVASASVRQDGEKIQFQVPAPKSFDRVIQLLKPALISTKAWAKETQQRNALHQIGVAFHNFHDAMAKLPGAGRNRQEGPIGLSWRVHLLPYLDQAPLYREFKLDEPWDSDHNKKLIEKMPAIFKSPGVNDVEKTTVHVFTGPGAPFANEKTPGFREFADGISVTILAVLAGPETADFWTRPGGLDFDPDDPIKSLGTISGKDIVVLFADAAVRELDKAIDTKTLRCLIQLADGEPVQIP